MKHLKLSGFILILLFINFLVQVLCIIGVGIFEGLKAVVNGGSFYQFDSVGFLNSNINNILILTSAISFLFYLLIYKIRRKNLFTECSFNWLQGRHILYAGAIGSLLNIFNSSFLHLTRINRFFPSYDELMEMLLGNQNTLMTLIAIGIIVPISEEILFRGIIFKELNKNMHYITAIILQSVIFAVYHFDMLQGMFAFILGLVLGFAYKWLNSIWAPIIIHVMYNCTSILLDKIINFNFPKTYLIFITLLSGLGVALFIYLTNKSYCKNNTGIVE